MGIYVQGGKKVGGMYMADGQGNATKIGGMYYANGKGNATKIYSSFLPVGTVLWSGNSGGANSYTVELSQPITKCKTGLAFSFNTSQQRKSLDGGGINTFTEYINPRVITNKISKEKLTIGSTATLSSIVSSGDFGSADVTPSQYDGPYGSITNSEVKVQVVSETTLKVYLSWMWSGYVIPYDGAGNPQSSWHLSTGGVLPVTNITSY